MMKLYIGQTTQGILARPTKDKVGTKVGQIMIENVNGVIDT